MEKIIEKIVQQLDKIETLLREIEDLATDLDDEVDPDERQNGFGPDDAVQWIYDFTADVEAEVDELRYALVPAKDNRCFLTPEESKEMWETLNRQ